MAAQFEAQPDYIHQDIKECVDVLKVMGVTKFSKHLQRELDMWKHTDLNIAVVGNSGAGKSSLINAILDLETDDDGMAKVGVVETTKTVTTYRNNNRPNLALHDFPGVGTPNYPQKGYFDKIGHKLSEYDFFLIVSSDRFTEYDLWFAKQIKRDEKHFYFVRTHIDLSIYKDKRPGPKKLKAKKVMEEVKKSIYEPLKKEGVIDDDCHIFLINNDAKLEFDFERLLQTLIKDSPVLKRQTMILSLAADVDETINEKVKILKGRMYKVALLASSGSAVPVPGVGLAAEAAVLYKEGCFYREQLGIDDKGLRRLSNHLNIEIEQLMKNFHLESHLVLISAKELIKWASVHVVSEALEDISKLILPVLGSLISAVASFPLCLNTLNKLLTMCETEARQLHNEVARSVLNDDIRQ
ncbi:interferon-inducible GTPase 1-like [Mya arenaria]|uniref:interferon-inducible GTPase 1-like n=1 Tax=Mya arenaria TaxID=6604 RepID=UPI0022E5036B|nr:interferon-inducible GTPase 1-like [Mya arenaria]